MKALVSSRNSRYMQYLSALTATLSVASSALHTTWTSPTLPKLTSENSPIGAIVTTEEASWIASVPELSAAFPGSIVAGFIVDKFGRRGSLLFAGIPLFFPWIAVVLAKSALVLIIARLIAGIGIGVTITTVSMYIGEIAEKDIRGKLGTAINTLKLMGSLYVLSVGPFISYTALALSCSAIPLLFMTSFYFMPETPYFLIKAGRKEEAWTNLMKLSSNATEDKLINQRLNEIADTVEHDMRNKSSMWELFSNKKYRKSLIVMFVFIAATLVDKMGRKPLMIISSLGCALALIGEGVYFYLQDELKTDVGYLSWLPTTGLVLFLVMNPIGLYTLPYVLLGELFATNIKGIAVSVFTFYGAFLSFLVVKFFQPISDAWGMHMMFWIYAGMCILGSVFVLFVLPETKGKTFAEIQRKLNKNRSVH